MNNLFVKLSTSSMNFITDIKCHNYHLREILFHSYYYTHHLLPNSHKCTQLIRLTTDSLNYFGNFILQVLKLWQLTL